MERQVKITAQLYGARDTAKFLLGADYKTRIQPMVKLIRASAKHRGVSELLAATDLANEMARSVSSQSAVMMLAAYVELAEPSNT